MKSDLRLQFYAMAPGQGYFYGVTVSRSCGLRRVSVWLSAGISGGGLFVIEGTVRAFALAVDECISISLAGRYRLTLKLIVSGDSRCRAQHETHKS